MGQFAKHIYIKNSAGTIQAVNLYSTAGEAGSWRIRGANVDGQDAYIPCVPYDSTEARRTSAVFTNGAGTWRFATVGAPPYATAYYNGGSGSFTVPTGVTRLRVTCVGGGAGGCNMYEARIGKGVHYGSSGGATTFGSVSAAGAGPLHFSIKEESHQNCDSESGCSTYYTYHIEWFNNSAGFHYGWQTGGEWYYGHSTPLRNYLGTDVAYAGQGGRGSYANGGSGYRSEALIDVTPGQVIGWSVGGGGAGLAMGTGVHWINYDYWSSHSQCAGCGFAGAIFVEWGQGIQ